MKRQYLAVPLLAMPILLSAVVAANAQPASDESKTKGLLASLEARCLKMITLQTAIHDGTRKLHKAIEKNPDRKPRPQDEEHAVRLAKQQEAVIIEATKAIDSLRDAAVAFPEVFDQIRADMRLVQVRLERIDVGNATQTLQRDIIDTLQEMNAPRR